VLPPLRTPRLPKIPFAIGNRKRLNLRCQRTSGPAARKQVFSGLMLVAFQSLVLSDGLSRVAGRSSYSL
jgi:hypothetical protein